MLPIQKERKNMAQNKNQGKSTKKAENLREFVFSDSNAADDFDPQVKNHRIYRYVLGCSLLRNSKSRQIWDEKLIEKEEDKSLVSEGR